MSIERIEGERKRLKMHCQTLGRLSYALTGLDVEFDINYESDAVVLVASSEEMLLSIQVAIENQTGRNFVEARNEFDEPWRNSRRSANLSPDGEPPMLVVLCVQLHPA